MPAAPAPPGYCSECLLAVMMLSSKHLPEAASLSVARPEPPLNQRYSKLLFQPQRSQANKDTT